MVLCNDRAIGYSRSKAKPKHTLREEDEEGGAGVVRPKSFPSTRYRTPKCCVKEYFSYPSREFVGRTTMGTFTQSSSTPVALQDITEHSSTSGPNRALSVFLG